VRRLAPEVAFENPWEATDPVRVADLLEHNAGWDDVRLRELAKDANARPRRCHSEEVSSESFLVRRPIGPGADKFCDLEKMLHSASVPIIHATVIAIVSSLNYLSLAL
jgi:hypothetical protein